jgi:pyruvate formate lyase activating enzyme
MVKEAMLYEKLSGRRVCCHTCQRECIIEDERTGFCKTRQNRGGRLFTLIYGEVSTWRRAPIEIKPVYHYLPGSFAFSLGSMGCNFLCPGCQNWRISFAREEQLAVQTEYIGPEEAVKMAKKQNCQGISWTYNEPALWLEYILDTARLAKLEGLYTNIVTNGSLSLEGLDVLGPYLDVYRLDIKGFCQEAYRKIARFANWEGILIVASRAKHHWKMHVELVTNVIPDFNDDLEQLGRLAAWIKEELGAQAPWHITRFSPRWRLNHLESTPVRTLEQARQRALSEGLEFVYVGNVWSHPASHTYCPGCGTRVIERNDGVQVVCDLTSNCCPECGTGIAGRFA